MAPVAGQTTQCLQHWLELTAWAPEQCWTGGVQAVVAPVDGAAAAAAVDDSSLRLLLVLLHRYCLRVPSKSEGNRCRLG